MLRAHRLPAVRICLMFLAAVLASAVVLAPAASAHPSRAATSSSLHKTASARASKRRARSKKSSSARRTKCVATARGGKRRRAGKHRKAGKSCVVKTSKTSGTKPSVSRKRSGSEPSSPEPPGGSGSSPGESTPPLEPVAPVEPPPVSEPTPVKEPVPTPVEAPKPTSGGLSIAVSGNHLVNGSGQVVTLHGVNISGTEWQCLYGKAFYGPHNEESIAAIAAWHVNAVRIPLNEDCWLGINGAPTDVNVFHEEIRHYVEQLYAHGMYAILDLHWSAPEDILSHLGAGFEGYFEMADETHAPAFWTSVASYFKEDHAALFDLFNEPKDISWSCWLNGCVAPRGYQTAGMQQLVDAVRATGATQPVMVAGLESASELGNFWLENHPVDPIDQLVASVHMYDQRSINHFNTNVGTVASKFPVVAGELGETDCSDKDIDAFLPWADEHGVSYVAWAWFVGSCTGYPSLISEYNGTPTNYGIGYREHLLTTFPAP